MAAALASFSRMTLVFRRFSISWRTGKFAQSCRFGERMIDARIHVDESGNADADAREIAGALMLGGQRLNGVAHLADDVVAALLDLGSGGDFLQHLAVVADGGDAQVGTAKIDCDGKNAHDGLKVFSSRMYETFGL